MKTLAELKEYLDSNNFTIEVTRHVYFYRQELCFKTFYNSNQLNDLLSYLAPYFGYNNGSDLVIFTDIKPIGDEKQLNDSIEQINAIDNKGNRAFNLSLVVSNLILSLIDKIKIESVVYPDFKLELQGKNTYNNNRFYTCTNRYSETLQSIKGAYTRGENSNWYELFLSGYDLNKKQVDNNTQIGLEISHIQYKSEMTNDIIFSHINVLKSRLKGLGINCPFINDIQDLVKDKIGSGNYNNSDPLAIFEQSLTELLR